MTEPDPQSLRHVLGHFLTGVTIVTTTGPEGGPVGMTANAFTSVSLEPPLVLVCVAASASSFAAMEEASHYAVHFLHEGQHAVSSTFARSAADGTEKFAGVEWHRGETGVPLLDDSLARLECRVVQRIELGDHVAYIGRVEAAHPPEGDAAPLGFYRGSYAQLSGSASGR